MFWNNHTSAPQMDVLYKEDLTLNELLDQENILQELKSQNMKLIEFITRHDVMAQLVSLVIEEPSSDMDERERYRRSNIACEVLTTDIPKLNEKLSENPLLSQLYAFLEAEPPLNPLLASFFSRTMSVLICRKTDQNWYSYQFTCLRVLEFFKSKDNSLELLLNHLGTSAIMDLTLKLITQVEGTDTKSIILNWFENEGLVGSVISLFEPSVDSDRHYNAAQLLCDTIYKCRESLITSGQKCSETEPILNAIQSPQMIEKLLQHMLGGELSESSIVGGVSVLLALLDSPTSSSCSDFYGRRNYNSLDESGSGEPPDYSHHKLVSIVSAIVPYLPKLHDLLINPPKKNSMKLAFGVIDPPLGNTRLSVIKLLAALISTNIPQVNNMLIQLNTMEVLLDLFFHYIWNNFLHTQIFKCLAFALNAPIIDESTYNPLISNILIDCRILQKILDAWEDNATIQGTGGKRRGYMGHLTNIANVVVKLMDRGFTDFLKDQIDSKTMVSWKHFVENELMQINRTHDRCLGGKHPAQNTPKDDNEADFSEVRFASDDASTEQGFLDDQIKQHQYNMEFANDRTHALEDALSKVSKEEMLEGLFSSMEHIGPDIFSGEEKRGEDWDVEVWADLPNSSWNNSDDILTDSSDDEEKGNAESADEGYADSDLWNSIGVGTPVVDPGNPWLKVGNELGPAAVETGNEGWADFDANFTSTDSIEDQLQAVQLSDEPPQENINAPPTQDGAETETGDSSEISTPSTDATVVVAETSGKSDNNANINSLIKEEIVPDDELIDNFRFLSKQGMMVQNIEPPSQETTVDAKEEIISEASLKVESETTASKVEMTNKVPEDPV